MSELLATEKCPVCGKTPSPITTSNGNVWDAFFKCDLEQDDTDQGMEQEERKE